MLTYFDAHDFATGFVEEHSGTYDIAITLYSMAEETFGEEYVVDYQEILEEFSYAYSWHDLYKDVHGELDVDDLQDLDPDYEDMEEDDRYDAEEEAIESWFTGNGLTYELSKDGNIVYQIDSTK